MIVDVIGELVVLVAVNEGILPVPLAPRPIAVLEFDQLNVFVPPVLFEVKLIIPLAAPAQRTLFPMSLTNASGFTTTVLRTGGPSHAVAPGPVGVIV